jgi:hypothetical protein
MRGSGAGFKAGCGPGGSVMGWGMSALNYLKAGFWHRVPLPLLGRVPLNAAALAGFGVAGFDHPALWVAGAGWQALWLVGTAGRAAFRAKVDAAARLEKWRQVEERRLQLYNQLPEASRLRHHTLRRTCQAMLAPAQGREPDAAAELFTWLHLKLLLARHHAAAGRRPQAADPDLPRLQAGAAIDLTDPARSRLADEAVALLDPRHPLADQSQPVLPALEAALARIESELAAMRQGKLPADFARLAMAAATVAGECVVPPETAQASREVERILGGLGEETAAGRQMDGG